MSAEENGSKAKLDLRILNRRERQGVKTLAAQVKRGEFEVNLGDGLPFITEKTYAMLVEEFNLASVDVQVNNDGTAVCSNGSPAPYMHCVKASEMYAQHFGDTLSNGGFLYQIGTWMDNVYRGAEQEIVLKNAAFAGASFVLRAFHVQCGPEILDKLKETSPKDLLAAFSTNASPLNQRLSVVDRARNVKKIPTHQVFLNTALDQTVNVPYIYPLAGYAFNDGAFCMYDVLQNLWPKIKA